MASETGSANRSASKESKEVLDLIDEKKPRVRRKAAASVALQPEAPAAEPEEAQGKTLADQKAEALNLLDEGEAVEKKKKRRPVSSTKETSVLPPISRVREAQEKGMAPEAEPAVASVAEEAEEEAQEEEAEGEEEDPRVIHIKPPILVKDLAERMGMKPHKLIAELLLLEVFANAAHALEPDIATKVCERHGFIFEKEKREKGKGVHKVEEVVVEPPKTTEEEEEEDELILRAPIITFMGHVDHGKTSLLDALRKSRVTAGEHGGITQHIGAYGVEIGGRPITFLDTPGHAAFTEMRARGAHVTDIVLLVIAADDGIMPQTKEAISHAQAADVAIMVAINKVDMATADVDRVKRQLQEAGLTPEDWGGETICVEVSATKGTGLKELLELMALQAEVLELRANPDGPARAVVIEASFQPGRGPTATVIVDSGTLRVGMSFICGPYYGKVKSLVTDRGEPVKTVGPAMPAEVLGFNGLPFVGDELVQMDSERMAKRLGEERQQEMRQKKLTRNRKSTLEDLIGSMVEGERRNLKVVLKTDVQGSAEAIVGALKEIESAKIDLDIIHFAAGSISESDILLASASDAIVIGFNVKVEGKAVTVAKREQVQVRLFSIIYELIDQVKDIMLGMLAPEHREKMVGHARVKQVFKLTRGIVAGCVVIDGRVRRSARARVLRGDQPVYDGGFATLRRFQEDVTEVRNGLECGIRLGDFTEYKEDDIIECYELERIEQTL